MASKEFHQKPEISLLHDLCEQKRIYCSFCDVRTEMQKQSAMDLVGACSHEQMRATFLSNICVTRNTTSVTVHTRGCIINTFVLPRASPQCTKRTTSRSRRPAARNQEHQRAVDKSPLPLWGGSSEDQVRRSSLDPHLILTCCF